MYHCCDVKEKKERHLMQLLLVLCCMLFIFRKQSSVRLSWFQPDATRGNMCDFKALRADNVTAQCFSPVNSLTFTTDLLRYCKKKKYIKNVKHICIIYSICISEEGRLWYFLPVPHEYGYEISCRQMSAGFALVLLLVFYSIRTDSK